MVQPLIYRLELAENKKVNESRVIFLDSVRPSYNHALPVPDVYIAPNVSDEEEE